MGAKITLNGNLGDDPRCGVTTSRNNEPLHWISFSMRQPHWSKNDRGEFIDSGGFWINVSWFDKKAEIAGRLLKKGAAVIVSGDLHVEVWVDKDTGEQKAAYKVNADEVSLDMRSLADVTYRQRSTERGPQPQPNIGNSHQGGVATQTGGFPANISGNTDFENIPSAFMNNAPQGNATPPQAADTTVTSNEASAGNSGDQAAHNPAFPTDDGRPI